jgi:hypothetical protein
MAISERRKASSFSTMNGFFTRDITLLLFQFDVHFIHKCATRRVTIGDLQHIKDWETVQRRFMVRPDDCYFRIRSDFPVESVHFVVWLRRVARPARLEAHEWAQEERKSLIERRELLAAVIRRDFFNERIGQPSDDTESVMAYRADDIEAVAGEGARHDVGRVLDDDRTRGNLDRFI